jgi:hypothetical protein
MALLHFTPPAFERTLDEVLNAYPLGSDSVRDYLVNMPLKFPAGDDSRRLWSR